MTKTLIGAFLTWMVPLLVSFGLYNSQTGIYLPNYVGFKIIMALIAAAMAYFTMRWIAKSKALNVQVPALYVGANALLDIALLVVAFTMPLSFWASSILPIYFVIFFGVYFVLNRKS